jgi:ribosome-associated translation inhibitor RaiA
MDIPLELAFHNMEPSDALKAAVQDHVAKLETFFDHIIGCRVVIEIPHKSHRVGSNAPDVHVILRVPGREIVVSREHAADGKAAVNGYAVLSDAFQAVQQQLKDYRRIRQGDVKHKPVSDETA